MKKKTTFLRLFALLLCAALLFPALAPVSAAADEGEEGLWIPPEPDDYGVLEPQVMEQMVRDYVTTWGLQKGKISIGYCYLDTGDTWYYNGDEWTYSADLYKVPLMMTLASWEARGNISQDTVLKGLTLAQAEEYTLVYNSTPYAKDMMTVVGTPEQCREEYQKLSGLPDEYFGEDFYENSYFTARVVTEIMKTLYNDPDNYPTILERLKRCDPEKYFRSALKGMYEVAQKFGTLTDRSGTDYNHCTGIIYTEHPFVLTVMTTNMGVTSAVLKDMCTRFADYTMSRDAAYAEWLEHKDDPVVTTPPVATEPPVTEAPVEETETAEAPAEGGEAAQTPAEGGETVVEPAPTEAPAPAEEKASEEPEKTDEERAVVRRIIVIVLAAALCVIFILGSITKAMKRGKRDKRR